jgi:hypothetical protein
VVARLVQQDGHVRVVEPVQDGSALAAGRHEPQVTQDPQLLRRRGRRHARPVRKLTDAGLGIAERVQQPQTGGSGERLHQLGDRERLALVERLRGAEPFVDMSLGHVASALYPHSYAGGARR